MTKTRDQDAIREAAAMLGRLGGPARARKLSKERRQEIARTGGLAGGAARSKKLSKDERQAIASAAARARWAKVRAKKQSSR